MDVVYECRKYSRVGVGKDAMAKVEDVSAALTLVDNPVCLGKNAVRRTQANSGVKVALQDACPTAFASHIKWDTPVDAQHIGANIGHFLEKFTRGNAEMHRWDVALADGRKELS